VLARHADAWGALSDDKFPNRPPIDRVTADTSDRVDGMTDESRVDLARKLAGRRDTVPDAGLRGRPATLPHHAVTKRAAVEEAESAAQVVRLQADLHRTERRLHQIERKLTSSRYQMAEAGRPTGRYARLIRRADRLERRLRSLR
jgi:hypothetical protein